MPLDPTPAQSAASRANGSLGQGPASETGKARSAMNGVSHGLAGTAFVLLAEEQVMFDRLHAQLILDNRAQDVQALALVESLARTLLLHHRLEDLEMAVLNDAIGLGRAEPEEGQPVAQCRLPSLASLCRYRIRLERREQALRLALIELRAIRDDEAADEAEEAPVLEPLGTSEPERHPQAPPWPPLNRQERRRQEALARQRAKAA